METLANLPGDLLKYYIDGGPVMHGISVFSLFSLTAIVYKLVIFRRVRMNVNEFIAKVRSALLKGNVKGAIQVCEESRSPVASITKSALLKYGQPRESIEKAVENAAIHEVAYLEKFLSVLATIANIAPLLGFLGTVVGMILSFDVIAQHGLNNGRFARGMLEDYVALAHRSFDCFQLVQQHDIRAAADALFYLLNKVTFQLQ